MMNAVLKHFNGMVRPGWLYFEALVWQWCPQLSTHASSKQRTAPDVGGWLGSRTLWPPAFLLNPHMRLMQAVDETRVITRFMESAKARKLQQANQPAQPSPQLPPQPTMPAAVAIQQQQQALMLQQQLAMQQAMVMKR